MRNNLPTVSSSLSPDSQLCFWWSHPILLCLLKPASLRSINLFIIKNKIHYMNWWWGCHTEKEIQMYWITFPVFLGEPSCVGRPWKHVISCTLWLFQGLNLEQWLLCCACLPAVQVCSLPPPCASQSFFILPACPFYWFTESLVYVLIIVTHLPNVIPIHPSPQPTHFLREILQDNYFCHTFFGCVVFCWREVDWSRAIFLEKTVSPSPWN